MEKEGDGIIKMIITDIKSTENKYGIIYTDPPWQQSRGGRKSVRPNSSGCNLPYNTMKIDDIIKLHSDVFNNLTDDKHNVFMWTIDKYLVETEQFMKELGYTRHARIIWDKITGQATAFTLRFCHEYLIWFYKKGDILMPAKECRGKYSDVIREQVRKHSQKPNCAYEMLEEMFPNANKLELFARQERDGWDCWENEV